MWILQLTSDDGPRPPSTLLGMLWSQSSTLASDTFTGTNGTNLTAHTMDLGPGWAVDGQTSNVAANWQISSNQATYTGGNTSGVGWTILTNVSQANVTVSAAITWGNSSAPSRDAGLVFRWSSAAAFFSAFRGVNSLFLQENGSVTRGSSSPVFGTTDTLQVVCSGGNLTVNLNGVQQIAYTTSNDLTNTQHGLYYYTNQGSGATTSWDNFLVTSP